MGREPIDFRLERLPTRRALLGLAAALGLGELLSGEAKKRRKKRGKKRKKKERCANGQIRERDICLTLCEDHPECDHPQGYCPRLADGSVRVCVIEEEIEPWDYPKCLSKSSDECAPGKICIDFHGYMSCMTPV